MPYRRWVWREFLPTKLWKYRVGEVYLVWHRPLGRTDPHLVVRLDGRESRPSNFFEADVATLRLYTHPMLTSAGA